MKGNPNTNPATKPGWASEWPQIEAQRRKKGIKDVSWSEYDFSGITEAELRACVYYEYARESAKIAEYVEDIKTQYRERAAAERIADGQEFTLDLKVKKFTKSRSPNHDSWILAVLAGQIGFPRVAWQDLKPSDRKTLAALPGGAARMHNQELQKRHPVLRVQTIQDDDALGTMTLRAWAAKWRPAAYQTEEQLRKWQASGFLLINMGYSIEEILKRFTVWLRKRHPQAAKPQVEKRGRNSDRDRLNALGAMRLRFYCRTLQEAQELTQRLKSKDRGLCYSDRTAWNRASDRAVTYFQEVLDVRDTNLPIHFTKGWHK